MDVDTLKKNMIYIQKKLTKNDRKKIKIYEK